MTVIIAGAGIGGLALALSLHEIGVPCQVYESVDELRPLGVGINVQPHAIKELEAMGLLPALDAIAVRTQEVGYFNAQGQKIWAEPRGTWAGYRWPQLSIHRGRLQFALLDAVRERLGPDAVTTGARVTGWRSTTDGVEVELEDRAGAASTVTGAALVGCDGIHSAVRRRMYPDEGLPRWSGTMLWRGVSEAPAFLTGATMAMAGDRNRKFVCYPIGESNGRAVVNWIADLRYPEDYPWKREDWNRLGDPDEILPRFENWRFDWLDVPALIAGAERIYEYPMVDRDPLPRWTAGGATLLGDAAHPMYPIGSNGATQAILDARALARAIRDRGIVEGMQAYESERRPATSRIVEANRGDGPDKVLDIVAARAPEGFARLEDVISQDELVEIAAGYKKIAGFEVESLNARPAILDA